MLGWDYLGCSRSIGIQLEEELRNSLKDESRLPIMQNPKDDARRRTIQRNEIDSLGRIGEVSSLEEYGELVCHDGRMWTYINLRHCVENTVGGGECRVPPSSRSSHVLDNGRHDQSADRICSTLDQGVCGRRENNSARNA